MLINLKTIMVEKHIFIPLEFLATFFFCIKLQTKNDEKDFPVLDSRKGVREKRGDEMKE